MLFSLQLRFHVFLGMACTVCVDRCEMMWTLVPARRCKTQLVPGRAVLSLIQSLE